MLRKCGCSWVIVCYSVYFLVMWLKKRFGGCVVFFLCVVSRALRVCLLWFVFLVGVISGMGRVFSVLLRVWCIEVICVVCLGLSCIML